ncbi:MAG: hypothetical protein ACLGGV_01410 [Bacteroidia bacterium]
MVISQHRISFYFYAIISFIGVLIILSFIYYFSLVNGKIDFRSVIFWIGIIFFIVSFLHFIRFALYGFKKIKIDDSEIIISYPIIGKIRKITKKDINTIRLMHMKNFYGVSWGNGYYQLTIELFDNSIIEISEMEYKNFDKLKTKIYEIRKSN